MSVFTAKANVLLFNHSTLSSLDQVQSIMLALGTAVLQLVTNAFGDWQYQTVIGNNKMIPNLFLIIIIVLVLTTNHV